ILLLVGMLGVIMAAGWSQRSNPDPSRRAIGAASLATSLMLVVLGATAQYITFAGLSQEIAMVVGLLGALTTQSIARGAPVVVIQAASVASWSVIPRSIHATLAYIRRLKPEAGLLRSSAVVFSGFAVARALGFLFSVAAARILNPLDYGRLTYVIALITVMSMFIS